jgi:hypothetical protein
VTEWRRGCSQESAGAGQAELEKDLASKLEAEREKRVEHLQGVAARRIGQMGLARGWSGWHEQWSEKRRRRQLLQAAGARLMRPMLAASLSHWRQDWAACARAASERGKQRLLADLKGGLEAELKAVRAELSTEREKTHSLARKLQAARARCRPPPAPPCAGGARSHGRRAPRRRSRPRAQTRPNRGRRRRWSWRASWRRSARGASIT